ncbi:hypothetical protein QJS10_CPB14g00987 [Acorus calamus]|uniref:Uncharacterized protein n=1 Tax=Acorus calamus TaxID=4465 RepID=A0AAV9DH56_ACOCL|nr:hypothetical protein QJS10_CPB14g00987 [Acorus calamus]
MSGIQEDRVSALSSKGAIDLCVAQMKNVLSAQQLPLNASMEILGRAYYATKTFVQAKWAPLSPPRKMSGENWVHNGAESELVAGGRFGHRNLHCKVERMEAEVGKAMEGLGGLLVAVGGAHWALVFAKSQLRKLVGRSDLSINSEKSRDADDSSSVARSSGINSPYTDELSELLSQSDIWLGRAELLQSLLGSGIVASLDDIADKESSARLRDRLIEDERYNMAIYTCKKCKIDSFPVWNAWGHALIRVEHYAQARVKFKYLHKWDLDAAMDIFSMCGCHLPQSDPIRYDVEADCKEDPEGLALTLAGKVLKEFPSLRDNNLILTYSAKAIAKTLGILPSFIKISECQMEILGQAYYATETIVHIDSFPVWNAWGHAMIRVEPCAQAHVKFKQAFQLYKGDPTPVIPEIINELEGSPPVDVSAVRSMYEHLAKSAPTILDDSLSADSYLNVLYMPSTFPRSERSRQSQEVSNPQYSSNSEFDDGPCSNLDNMRYFECINYFKEYAHQLMLGFMFRHGHYTDACMLFFPPDGIAPQPLSLPLASPSSSTQRMDPLATDYGTIDELCDLCVGFGAMGILEDIISGRVSMTASQDSAVSQYTASALARICVYCETHRLLNFLYRFQGTTPRFPKLENIKPRRDCIPLKQLINKKD